LLQSGFNDGDLELHVYKQAAGDTTYTTPGSVVCASSTYDSTHELCDLPVIAGEDYLFAIRKFATSATWTYLGLAWYQYRQPSGSVCSSPGECASRSCVSGRCGCSSDLECPDRSCVTGQCTTLANGMACTTGNAVPLAQLRRRRLLRHGLRWCLSRVLGIEEGGRCRRHLCTHRGQLGS
jgi:hypothetical protein